MNIDELISSLVKSGVTSESIVRLDQEASPRHLRYIDLIGSHPGEIFPDAVIESSGQPFAYVVRQDRLGESVTKFSPPLAQLVRILACRSDARYLCVVSIGALEVYPIGLFEEVPAKIKLAGRELTLKTLLSGATPLLPNKSSQIAWLESLLFSLLVEAAKGIQSVAPQLSTQQVLALVGRALFCRFLVDRHIVKPSDLESVSPLAQHFEDIFSTPKTLIDTCHWLDATFNGDLLSLNHKDYEYLIKQIGPEINVVCWHLSNIQYRALGGQLPLNWGGISFRHVPVDVLSQVYEDFAHEFIPDLAEKTSVHFTPRQIAEVVVDGAFSASNQEDVYKAKVLDPAAGGGVFLVLAFRRLIVENWKHYGKRPSRRQIRRILNDQLRGFDINCDALNIAALSLYLAALEVDPSPSPINDLKFEKLIGSVLIPASIDHPHSLQKSGSHKQLGSLSSDAFAFEAGTFDIVVANPPWTGFKDEQAILLNEQLSTLLNDSSGDKTDKTRTRYGSPDIAFLLGATRWAKPGGSLGFVVHARFLFQEAAYSLRRGVFERIRITGIMNFSALRQDKRLWPTNSAPFALMVGRNEPSKRGDNFYYISPRHEAHLAEMGQFRVDPTAAIPVPLDSIYTNHCFKSIFKGGLLGFRLINHIQSQGSYSVSERLTELGLTLKAGFQVGKPDKQVQDAAHLQAYPVADVNMTFCVKPDASKFSLDKLQWARSPEIYQGPLLLFRESPKLEKALRGALFCPGSTAFSESFSGISFHNKPEHSELINFLYVLSYSDLFLYFQLLTSSKFGVERDAAQQKDMEQFPLIDLDEVSLPIKKRINYLASRLQNMESCWEEVDDVIAELYDLTPADTQLISDTLATELPFSEIKKWASSPVSQQDIVNFLTTFNQLISPFQESSQTPLLVGDSKNSVDGWEFFEILSLGAWERNTNSRLTQHDVLSLTKIAGSYWATQIRVHLKSGSELVGRISQNRYWTKTQARLLALEWLQRSIY
jgi:hypothetical protein